MSHLTTALKNPYLWVLLIPLVTFVSMVMAHVSSDDISVPVRIAVFFVLAYVAARYASRAPRLMWEGNVTPEGRNIAGYGLFLVSQMIAQCYTVLYLSLDRPAWLSSAYYAPAFVSLGLVGLLLVASSIPKFPMPPFFGPGRGMSGAASIIFALISVGVLWLVSHAPPVAVRFITGLFAALTHAV